MNEDVLDVIRKRRTIRKFNAHEVSDEQIETLLELAMDAPNRLNRQPWHFVVVRDKSLQRQFADVLRIHPYLETASAVIAVDRGDRDGDWFGVGRLSRYGHVEHARRSPA
jgi:nitroreductase